MTKTDLIKTIGNQYWLRENEQKLKSILPQTWTHIQNLNGIQIGFQLKLIGVNWSSEQEFGNVMGYLEKIGILLRDSYNVKANPRSIFDK